MHTSTIVLGGTSCNKCNLKLEQLLFIHVLLHNLKNKKKEKYKFEGFYGPSLYYDDFPVLTKAQK